MKILICDDIAAKASLLKTALRSHFPCEITHTLTASTTMSEISQHRYDLLLLDVTFPLQRGAPIEPLAGKWVLREMCEKDYTFPVIVMTQYHEFHDFNHPSERKGYSNKLGMTESFVLINDNYNTDSADLYANDDITLYNIYQIQGLHQHMRTHYNNYVGTIFMSAFDNQWSEYLFQLIAQTGISNNA